MKFLYILGVLILAGCDRGAMSVNSCYVEQGFLKGYTSGKVLHCEIHEDGHVSALVQP